MNENKHYRILDKMKAKHTFTYADVIKACSGKHSEAERWINDVLACGLAVQIENGYRINQ